MFEMESKFSKLVKKIEFECLRTNKTIGCSDEYAAYILCNRHSKQVFAKEKERQKKKKQKQKKPLKIDSGTGVFLLILQKF